MGNESGFSFWGTLRFATFVVFLTLKLAEVGVVATWSWWWVTSPLWAPLVALVPLGALLVTAKAITEAQHRRQVRELRSTQSPAKSERSIPQLKNELRVCRDGDHLWKPLGGGPWETCFTCGRRRHDPHKARCPQPTSSVAPVQTLPPIAPAKLNRLRRLRISSSGRSYGAVGTRFGWSK